MESKAKTPHDSIEIPPEYLELCEPWHGGIGSMFYAIASTGGLTMGLVRSCGETDDEWYLSLWNGLSSELALLVKISKREEHEDHPLLLEFEEWTDKIVERLQKEYGLED